MARASMIDLIARLQGLCGNDTTFESDDYQSILDNRVQTFDYPLVPTDIPSYTRFTIPVENIEKDAEVYISGSRTILTETTDYTFDYQRGIITTPALNTRTMNARGTSYAIFHAAADAWERIAARYVLDFDFRDVEGVYNRSQRYQQCISMAQRYRAMAGATSESVERGDTPPTKITDWHNARFYKRSDGAAT